MINSMLASILSTINALLALVIIVVGAGAGSSLATEQGYSSGLGIAFGLVGGLLIAVMVCGVLALLIDIRAGIKEVAHLLKLQQTGMHDQT
jgi:TRAP-type C4-dicarboxylate transport system permease small subunit